MSVSSELFCTAAIPKVTDIAMHMLYASRRPCIYYDVFPGAILQCTTPPPDFGISLSVFLAGLGKICRHDMHEQENIYLRIVKSINCNPIELI